MARRGYSLLFAAGLYLSDIVALTFGFCFAFVLRFYSFKILPVLPLPSEIPEFIKYGKTLPFIWLIMGLCFWAGGLYRESLSFRKIVRTGSILKQIFYGIVILISLTAFYREVSFSRIFILMLFPLFFVFVVIGRWMLINIEYKIRAMQGKKHSLIIVGEGEVLVQLSENLQSKIYPDISLLGYVSLNKTLSDNKLNIRHLGYLSGMENILDTYQPDEVIFSTVNINHSTLTDIIMMCDKRMIQFYIVPDYFNFLTSKVELTSVGGINLIGLQKFPLDNGLNRLLKRIIDVLGSLTGVLLFSWLFLLLAAIIKCTSKGPVFFKQIRCHEDGKEFLMFKFRTMSENAEKETGPKWAEKGDKRCTRIGMFMRSCNLDELPQLFNVLKGDMSLVGPRPERPHFIDQFKNGVPRYMARHAIKPGMTGWAQVNGWRGNTSLEERIKYDLYYIEEWSIWLDLKILFLTFFSFKNAY